MDKNSILTQIIFCQVELQELRFMLRLIRMERSLQGDQFNQKDEDSKKDWKLRLQEVREYRERIQTVESRMGELTTILA